MLLVVASTSGMAGHFLWSDSAFWNDHAQGFLGLLSGSAGLLVVRSLCGLAGRYRWFDHAAYWTGVAGPALALAYLGINRQWGVRLIGSYLVMVIILSLGTAFAAWRRNTGRSRS